MCENDMFPKVRQRGSPVAALAEDCTWHGTFSGSLIALVGCVPGSGGLRSRHGTCRISLGLWTANCNSHFPRHLYIQVFQYLEVGGLLCTGIRNRGSQRRGRTDKAHNLVIPERHRPWTGVAGCLDDPGLAGMAAHVSAAQVTGRGYDMV